MEQTPIIPNSLAIFGLGQMGVAIKGPDATIYIDPCLSDVLLEQLGNWWNRAYPPPVNPIDVSNADYYLISHEHQDHLDPNTVGTVAKASPKAKFIAPKWCLDLLSDLDIDSNRIISPDALTSSYLQDTGLKLTPVPSAHYQKEFDEQKGYRWLGYLIEWNGITFYHSGDTIIYPNYIETLKKLPKADVAMIPVNGRDWFREQDAGVIGNLLPAEAARLSKDLGWDVVIPGHNDLYPNNAIPMSAIVDAFTSLVPRQKYKMLQPGELYYYVKQ
jgi:L-ascorbate metabolism protein UlaG (beta-lactamase superfamily)